MMAKMKAPLPSPPPNGEHKTRRIEVTLTAELHQLVLQASGKDGRSVANFIRFWTRKGAQEVIGRQAQ
jgi:uncharacterized protein (DUF1778 family)